MQAIKGRKRRKEAALPSSQVAKAGNIMPQTSDLVEVYDIEPEAKIKDPIHIPRTEDETRGMQTQRGQNERSVGIPPSNSEPGFEFIQVAQQTALRRVHHVKNREIKVHQKRPKFFLRYHCGCQHSLPNSEAARAHAEKQCHIVTVSGSVTPWKGGGANLEHGPSDYSDLDFEFKADCGCGFSAQSADKVAQHVLKTLHLVKVFGKISPTGKGEMVKEGSPRHSRTAFTPVEAAPPSAVVGGASRITKGGDT